MKALIKDTILEKIAGKVALRITEKKVLLSEASLEKICEDLPPMGRTFETSVRKGGSSKYSIIAEIKFKSPSEGVLNPHQFLPVQDIASGYLSNGAAAISVLTERDFFGGDISHLQEVRKTLPSAPLLMKDFILERYQLLEARTSGADCVLLIVRLLGEGLLRDLMSIAQSLGLSTLVEVHDEVEMRIATEVGATFIGVNNRDLNSLTVSLNISEQLISLAPKNVLLISESGIRSGEDLNRLHSMGYSGFLIGTSFMRTNAPGPALRSLVAEAQSSC